MCTIFLRKWGKINPVVLIKFQASLHSKDASEHYNVMLAANRQAGSEDMFLGAWVPFSKSKAV